MEKSAKTVMIKGHTKITNKKLKGGQIDPPGQARVNHFSQTWEFKKSPYFNSIYFKDCFFYDKGEL